MLTFPDLPIDLEIKSYAPNAELRGRDKILQVLKLPFCRSKRKTSRTWLVPASRNRQDHGQRQEVLLWAGSMKPSIVETGGKRLRLALCQRVVLSFDIRLDKFAKPAPGTNLPQEFVSEITKTEDGLSQQ